MRYVCEIKLKFCLDSRNHKINLGLTECNKQHVFFPSSLKFIMGVDNVGISAAQGG